MESKVETHALTPTLTFLALNPPVPGYETFIGYYLLRGGKNAIIDPGPRAAIPNLLTGLRGLGLRPEEIDYIVLTHIHIDHAGGAGTAIREMTNARVVAHERGHAHLVDPTRLWLASQETLGELAEQYGSIEPVPEDRLVTATDGMRLVLGGLALEILLTPGHAAHHLSLFEPAEGVLLAGDAVGVFTSGVLRPTTPPPFRLEETLSSIDRMIALSPRKLCFAHRGCQDEAVGMLAASRQKTIEWYHIVNQAAQRGNGVAEVLALLREKDRSLDYLDGLSPDEYSRDVSLLENTIRGMSAPR